MTAQHLCRTYAELVNCKRLTKNHKLNLRKIYAKLRKNLWAHKCCHKSIITANYVILLAVDHFYYSLIKQEDHIKPVTHLTVFCRNIFERDLSDAAKAPTHLRKFLLSEVSFTNRTISYFYCKSFLSHAVICDWPVRIGRSFMGTIALAIVSMSDNWKWDFCFIITTNIIVVVKLNFKFTFTIQ